MIFTGFDRIIIIKDTSQTNSVGNDRSLNEYQPSTVLMSKRSIFIIILF